MSVGRQLCKTAIDTAAELRRYARLMADFVDTAEAEMIADDATTIARRLELLVQPILAFEGEQLPALEAGKVEAPA